ncbi:MAG: hypothetical protein U0N90_04915 [Blautia sp.]|jgi:hypothetical protein
MVKNIRQGKMDTKKLIPSKKKNGRRREMEHHLFVLSSGKTSYFLDGKGTRFR